MALPSHYPIGSADRHRVITQNFTNFTLSDHFSTQKQVVEPSVYSSATIDQYLFISHRERTMVLHKDNHARAAQIAQKHRTRTLLVPLVLF